MDEPAPCTDLATAPVSVVDLYLYPVKGLSPQSSPSFQMVAGEGLPSDRRFALALGTTVFDPLAPTPLDKGYFLMLRRDESLAALATHLDTDTGILTIAAPKGARLDASVETSAGRATIEDFFHAYLGTACEGRPRLVEATGHKFTDVSVISPAMMRAVSLINLASVRDLAAWTGKALDPLRFRANIYLDGLAPWEELDWVGREVAIGSVRFRCVLRTRRCGAIDVDPRTGARDTNLPKALMRTFGHPDCGVYLEVLEGGEIRIGDVARASPDPASDPAT